MKEAEIERTINLRGVVRFPVPQPSSSGVT